MRFESKIGRSERRGGRFPLLGRRVREAGFVVTLPEVLIAVVIVALVFGGIIQGYTVAGKRTEWTGYSLAAQAQTVQVVEQVRSATWDIALGKTEITNLTFVNGSKAWPLAPTSDGRWTMTGYLTNIMDVPWRGTNFVVATNFVTISQIYANNQTNPSVQFQVVQVDTVWSFNGWGNFDVRIYTNTICTIVAPDNRDPSTLGAD